MNSLDKMKPWKDWQISGLPISFISVEKHRLQNEFYFIFFISMPNLFKPAAKVKV